MRKRIYGVGCPEGSEAIYVKRFLKHNADVMQYFKHRSRDLLVMDLAKSHGWEMLCPFLGIDIPDIPFPHSNKASDRETRNDLTVLRKIKNTIKRIAGRRT